MFCVSTYQRLKASVNRSRADDEQNHPRSVFFESKTGNGNLARVSTKGVNYYCIRFT